MGKRKKTVVAAKDVESAKRIARKKYPELKRQLLAVRKLREGVYLVFQ